MSVTQGTLFYQTNLSLMAWFYTILLFSNSSNGIRSTFVRKQVGLGARSSQLLCQSVRKLFAAGARPETLGGPGKLVHVDEVFLRYSQEPSERPTILWGCSCDGIVLSAIIPDMKATTVATALRRFVVPNSIVVTDGHPSYKQVSTMPYRHIRIDHSRSFHDFNGVTNNEIEGYWAVVRRAMSGYRSVSRDRLWLYLAEIEFRYNRRWSEQPIFDEIMTDILALSSTSLDALMRRFTL